MSQKLAANKSKTCNEQTDHASILHFWDKKNILNNIIIIKPMININHFHLIIFEGNLISTLTFLFKPRSLNCEADEAGKSLSISSTDLHLLSSKQSVFVCIL